MDEVEQRVIEEYQVWRTQNEGVMLTKRVREYFIAHLDLKEIISQQDVKEIIDKYRYNHEYPLFNKTNLDKNKQNGNLLARKQSLIQTRNQKEQAKKLQSSILTKQTDQIVLDGSPLTKKLPKEQIPPKQQTPLKQTPKQPIYKMAPKQQKVPRLLTLPNPTPLVKQEPSTIDQFKHDMKQIMGEYEKKYQTMANQVKQQRTEVELTIKEKLEELGKKSTEKIAYLEGQLHIVHKRVREIEQELWEVKQAKRQKVDGAPNVYALNDTVHETTVTGNSYISLL